MKKIALSVLAIALTVAIPSAAMAEDGVCYDNTNKTVLMDIVVQRINADVIQFTSYQAKIDFLSLCAQLYAYRDANNSIGVISTAQALEAASANIVNAGDELLVTSIFATLETVYADTDYWIITDSDLTNYSDALTNHNPGSIEVSTIKIHFAGCDKYTDKNGVEVHFAACSDASV